MTDPIINIDLDESADMPSGPGTKEMQQKRKDLQSNEVKSCESANELNTSIPSGSRQQIINVDLVERSSSEKDVYYVKIQSVESKHNCIICKALRIVKYNCTYNNNILYICHDKCLEKLQGNKCDVVVQEYFNKYYCPVQIDSNYRYARLCRQCGLSLKSATGVCSWEAMDYCNEQCLYRYQCRIASGCAECKAPVAYTQLGKYSVRFGCILRQFCSSVCLEKKKKKIKICSYCQKSINKSRTIIGNKFFCNEICKGMFEYLQKPKKPPFLINPNDVSCYVCKEVKPIQIEFDYHRSIFYFCSNDCFTIFKFIQNCEPPPRKCHSCNKYVLQQYLESNALFYDSLLHYFCSDTCQHIYIITHRRVVPCIWCKVKKYNFDMIQRNDFLGTTVFSCSLYCLNQLKKSIDSIIMKDTACHYCTKEVGIYELKMASGIIHNFCSNNCISDFRSQMVQTAVQTSKRVTRGRPKHEDGNAGDSLDTETTGSLQENMSVKRDFILGTPCASSTPDLKAKPEFQHLKSENQTTPISKIVYDEQLAGSSKDEDLGSFSQHTTGHHCFSFCPCVENKKGAQPFSRKIKKGLIALRPPKGIKSGVRFLVREPTVHDLLRDLENKEQLEDEVIDLTKDCSDDEDNFLRQVPPSKEENFEDIIQGASLNEEEDNEVDKLEDEAGKFSLNGEYGNDEGNMLGDNIELDQNEINYVNYVDSDVIQLTKVEGEEATQDMTGTNPPVENLQCCSHFVGNRRRIRTRTEEVIPDKPGPLPIITNVCSLAPNAKSRNTETSIKKIVIVQSAPNAEQNNVSTSVEPLKTDRECQCEADMVNVEVQTNPLEKGIPVSPIMVPIFVPAPLHMWNAPVPAPIPFPLIIPCPILIPLTKKSSNGIMNEIKNVQVKAPTDPFEAELLMMAELVAEKKDTSNEVESEEYENTGDEIYSPEPADTSNTFGDDMLQMALKLASDYEEPAVDLEGALTANTITPSQQQQSTSVGMESEDIDSLRIQNMLNRQSSRARKRGARQTRQNPSRRGRRPAHLDVSLIQPESSQPIEPIEKPDAHMCLKYTFGVNAWKQWVTTKNIELERSSRRLKLFKTELLQLTSDELNYSLCLFVKEVRKPNGSEYAPDTIYYLCLGIQQYLYENGRIDNIFCDPYYEKFTDCLDEVCQKFSILYNDSHYIVTRVEEEHLWESKQLGAHSPHVLLSTLMFFNTKHFNLTTVDEHMQLSFSHIMKHWKRHPNQPGIVKQAGSRNVLLRFYPPQSSLDGNSRKKKVYEQQENEEDPLRCPVKLYEFYLSKCPESVKTRNDVFYLLPERSCVPDSPVWYSTMALDRTSLEKMLHRVKMVKEINVALLAN